MSQLRPDYYIPHIPGVTTGFLNRHGVRGLILDGMRQAGVGMMIVSNNTEERVRPFAEILGLPYVADGKKPGTDGMRRAAEQLGGLRPEETAVIGDQIFTDVWGGNRFGALTIMVAPLGPETVPFIKLKRVVEKLVLRGRKPQPLEEV